MGIIKRSFVSLSQRYGKSAILLLVVFILGNVIAAAVTVRDSTANVEKAMKDQLGASVFTSYDSKIQTQFPGEMENFPFSRKRAEEIGENSRVKSLDYMIDLNVGSVNLKPFETDENRNIYQDGSFDPFAFVLVGSRNGIPYGADTGKVTLKEGVFPKEDGGLYTAAISEEVAKKNNLKIGDKFNVTLKVFDYAKLQGVAERDYESVAEKSQEFEVVGIFNRNKVGAGASEEYLNIAEKNNIYTNMSTVSEFDQVSAEAFHKIDKQKNPIETYLTPVLPKYTLNTTDDIEPFTREVKELLPNGFTMLTSQDNFKTVASSITNMNSLAHNVYIFGIIIATVILSLIIVIFLRERKQEFGIYQALGESRAKTVSQIAIEIFVVTIMGVSLAVFSGNQIARTVSTQMIENQLASSEKKKDTNDLVMIGGPELDVPEVSKEEIMKTYHVELSQEYILSFYTVMLGTATIATLISMTYILRLKPREILL